MAGGGVCESDAAIDGVGPSMPGLGVRFRPGAVSRLLQMQAAKQPFKSLSSAERLHFKVESNAGVRRRASVHPLQRTVGRDLAVRRSYGGQNCSEDETQHN